MLEIRTHTALHVLKGAIQSVLGAEQAEVAKQLRYILTAGVFVQGEHGRLTVQFERKPADDEIAHVEKAANQKIGENAAVEVIEMERGEAEAKFGNAIYDLFPLPSSITSLRICVIENWNINCCNKQHCATTGEIGVIKLGKPRFRENKRLLEIPFDVI